MRPAAGSAAACSGFSKAPGAGSHVDEGADFLALAGAEVGRGVEAGALLGEGGDDLEAQRLGQVAQFGQRGFELDVAHVRQLHGGDDGVTWAFP
jgi:hypothetical protein